MPYVEAVERAFGGDVDYAQQSRFMVRHRTVSAATAPQCALALASGLSKGTRT